MQIAFIRRFLLGAVLAGLCLGISGLCDSPAQAKADPVVRFMNRVKGPLIRAARNASRVQFLGVIRRYGDIYGIGYYSLGYYQKRLPRSRRYAYFRGVGRFMARYLAKQTRKYPIVRADIGRTSWRDGKSHYVDSRIYLKGGSAYSVRWEIKRTKRGYRIANVRVVGFWLMWFQRRLFQHFIAKSGGSVTALVRALNR